MNYAGRYRFKPRRVDANHAEIKSALTLARYDVIDTAKYGFPCDFLVIFQGVTYWIEVKDSEKSASQKKLTDEESKLAAILARNGCQLHVVESPDEALELLSK